MLKYALFLPLFIGCASIKPYQPRDLGTTHVFEKSYDLGTEQAAPVGAAVARVKEYYVNRKQAAAVFASEDFTLTGGQIRLQAIKDVGYPVVGRTSVGGTEWFVARVPAANGFSFGVLAADDGTISHKVINGDVIMVYSFKLEPNSARLVPREREEVSKTAGYTNFELLYSGRTDDSIRLTYREYTADDMARPAFFQELTYSSATELVRFRDFQIRVIEATDEQLRYVILRDGLSPTE